VARQAASSRLIAWPKVIGPPHVSLKDRGLTFAGNPGAGVCIRFHRPVKGVDPVGLIRRGSYRPLANKDNDYLMDRAAQRRGDTFSGVKGIAITASNESNGLWYYSTNGGTNNFNNSGTYRFLTGSDVLRGSGGTSDGCTTSSNAATLPEVAVWAATGSVKAICQARKTAAPKPVGNRAGDERRNWGRVSGGRCRTGIAAA
jgi:hypothetical protein